MSSIDPSRNLVAVAHREVSALRKRADAGLGRAAPASPPASMQGAAPAVLQRIRALKGDDPDRRQKAVRIYLESELAREFGQALLNDPGFPQMLEAIERQVRQDVQLCVAVDAAGDLLLARAQA